MTITNFERFRLERQQKQAMLEKSGKSQQAAAAAAAATMLMEQAQNSSSHYRDPRRLHRTNQETAAAATTTTTTRQLQDEQTNMAKVRPSRQTGGAGPGAPVAAASVRSSSMTRHYQPHQMRTLANQHTQQVGKQQQIQQEVWTSTEDLFWDHMREVQNKWNTLKLNDDIWAKLIYFERNRRLAKAYVSTPVLTVDGSTNGLDGFRIGLSGIENSYRDLDSMACLCSIGHGIKLKIDSQGNILIKKLSPPVAQQQQQQQQQQQHAKLPVSRRSCSIWVKEWPTTERATNTPHNHLASSGSSGASSASSDYSQLSGASLGSRGSEPSQESGWPVYELLDSKSSYKLFDMQKFRARLEQSQREADSATVKKRTGSAQQAPIDWRQCVSIISFVRSINVTKELPPGGATGQTKSTSGAKTQKQPISQQVLSDPCWLMLINIIAIDMLKSSVCDITSRPSPGSQTSALINRYQHERYERELAVAASRAGRVAPSLVRPASSHQLTAAGSPTTVATSTNGRHTQPAASSAEQLRRGSGGGGGVGGNTRNQASLSSSSSSSATALRLLASRSSQPQLHTQSASATDGGSIYTTFTGKYLDKQQRQRLNKQARRPTTDVALQPGSSIDDLRPTSTRRYTARHNSSSHLLYPLDPSIASSTFTMLQRQRQQRDRYGRLVPLAAPYGPTRRGGQVHQAGERRPQLSHSLSAFDLSHGLKLNLRSMNSTSIRMNFDESESDSDEHESGEHNVVNHYREPTQEVVAQRDSNKANNQEVGGPQLVATKKKVSMARKAFERLNGSETSGGNSEWASLARKFSMLNFKPIGESAAANNQNQSAQSEAQQTGRQEQISGTTSNNNNLTNQTKSGAELPPNASRSSIVSAASSSSGCPDNDYIISQSSNSSMSSSTRSNGEGEDLFSQPASSSGINCGSNSGNTSDEYERHAHEQQQQQQIRHDQKDGDANQASKGQSQGKDTTELSTPGQGQTLITTSNIKTRGQSAQVNELKRNKGMAASGKLTRNKQNISLNRCYNVKTIDFSDNELESSGACGPNAAHLNQCQLYHGTANHHSSSLQQTPPLRSTDTSRLMCDCGEPECDQYLLADGGPTCDCCCDCFYMESEVALSPLPACCDGGNVALPTAN